MQTEFSISLKTKHSFLIVPILLFLAFIGTCTVASAQEAVPNILPNYEVFSAGPQAVTITDTDSSAVLHYTTTGIDPTAASPTYTASFNVSTTTTVKAIAIGSSGTSAVATSVIQIDPSTANVPRSGLMTWQKSDLGLTVTSGQVTNWADASGHGMNLATTSGLGSPTYQANIMNGLPGVVFNGNNSTSLRYPTGFADLTAGCTIFITYDNARTGGQLFRTDNFGGDNIYLWPFWNSGIPSFSIWVNNGIPSFYATYYLNQIQNLAFVHNGSTLASYYINGQLMTQSTVTPMNNVARNQNFIGGFGFSNYISATYAEILLYNRALTATEFANVNAYLASRYIVPNPSAPTAPVFSLAAGTLSAPAQLAISSAPGGTTYATFDGSTPTTSSTVVSGPVQINYSETVKAITVQNGLSSAVTSASYTLDNTKFAAPNATDPTVMQINLQSPNAAQ